MKFQLEIFSEKGKRSSHDKFPVFYVWNTVAVKDQGKLNGVWSLYVELCTVSIATKVKLNRELE